MLRRVQHDDIGGTHRPVVDLVQYCGEESPPLTAVDRGSCCEDQVVEGASERVICRRIFCRVAERVEHDGGEDAEEDEP